MAIKQDNNFRCWLWFANNRQEELYEVITAMITDKINDALPQMIEEQLRQKIDNLSVNIQTTINGKASADFKDIITDMIIKEFQ